MGSIKAQRVAIKLSETIRKGKKNTSLGAILRESGYAKSTSLRPKQVTETQAFKKTFVMETASVLEGIDKELARIQSAMSRKNLDKEEFKTLTLAMDTLIKNKQLLSGGSTGNIAIQIAISEHVADKYKDVSKEGSTEP